jgi:hypothetical protein
MTAEYVGRVVSKFVMPAGSQWPGRRSIEVLLDEDLDDVPFGAEVRVIVISHAR